MDIRLWFEGSTPAVDAGMRLTGYEDEADFIDHLMRAQNEEEWMDVHVKSGIVTIRPEKVIAFAVEHESGKASF